MSREFCQRLTVTAGRIVPNRSEVLFDRSPIVEQDDRFIKKRTTAGLGFRSAEGACRTIEGYEAITTFGVVAWLFPREEVVAHRFACFGVIATQPPATLAVALYTFFSRDSLRSQTRRSLEEQNRRQPTQPHLKR